MQQEPDRNQKPTRREWTGFWCMIAQQAQNAFNDKFAQFSLVPLGGAVAFSFAGARMEDVALLLITLPFVLFAPLAGWLSDRYSKRDVLIGAAIAQTLILAALCGAVQARLMPLALLGFFALAVQSAVLSPAKFGLSKELLGSRLIGFASGIQQMATMLAMLVGQVAAGVIFDRHWQALGATPENAWQAARLPLAVLAVCSLPAVVLAWRVPRTPAHGGGEPAAVPGTGARDAPSPRGKLATALLLRHFRQLRELWSDAPLRRAAFGVSYFWGFAAFINLWTVKVAAERTGGLAGFGTLSSLYMLAASLGMIGGFAAAAFLLRRRIELGWVPVAGAAMTLLSLGLVWVDPISPGFVLILGALALASAVFLVPLNAWMQDRYPAARRGELQAAANLQDCLAGILALGLLVGLGHGAGAAGISTADGLRVQIAFAGVASALITGFIIRLLPSDFVRVIGLMLLRLVYRIRGSGEANLPESGGALLLPNHITWADAFFLTAASPRPVRFIMEEGFMGKRAIGVFCRLFDTVPISSAKPREALRAAADSLKQGHLVCLFPEGQLSRTGTLRELKRGFELIARQAACPLVPVWTDGAWGSILSFEGNRFFRKFPQRLRYGISIAFGPPIPPAEADLERVRRGMLEASAMALDARIGRFQMAPARRVVLANALQLGQVNALQRRVPVHSLAGDPLPGRLPGLRGFSKLRHAPLAEFPGLVPPSVVWPGGDLWLGGDALRDLVEDGPPRDRPAVFFDFSGRAARPLDRPDWIHCPCLAVDGVIVAMSMPDPPLPVSTSQAQCGRKPGTLGILLPGFAVEERGGVVQLRGPAAPDGLCLPAGCRLDAEGFIVP
jgi:acyl-[acyl-carrier-protein]-phospholipid O-acyltransferase/long-chain-fatty-acid--[acyl-carrier-protein] ligase